MLSGLPRCGVCGHSFTLDSTTHYKCGSAQMNACTNMLRVRRGLAEDLLLRPILNDLLNPKMVAAMAREMERYYAQRIDELQANAAGRPAELAALDARIARLRARLGAGDPDMTADELEATIERAMSERAELVGKPPTVAASAKVLSLLPKMAAAYRKQVEEGLNGDARAAAQARAIIEHLIGGTFKLVPEKGHLVAHFGLRRPPLLQAAGAQGFVVAGRRFVNFRLSLAA